MEKTMPAKPEKKAVPRTPGPHYSAMDRCKAVLSVWSEKRKPAEVCREYRIKWVVLGQWQGRALEGMLQALEPRVNLEKGPALSPRLQQLLEKRGATLTSAQSSRRLAARLARLQQPRTAGEPEKKTP